MFMARGIDGTDKAILPGMILAIERKSPNRIATGLKSNEVIATVRTNYS